jgi:hypothetical protein
VIHLSDEWGQSPEFSDIALCTPLYIRQYSHASYEDTNPPAIQIPLGYMHGMLGADTSLTVTTPRIDERTYEWAFVGALKHDRAHMVATFKARLGHMKGIHTNGLTPPEMYDIYKKAVFVLSGRGNVTLDCFRIYEAIIAGAIPVIVGSEEEIGATFRYAAGRIPCVYATSWEGAATKCAALLSAPGQLQNMQDELRVWWKSQIAYLREKILSIQ